MKLADNTIPVVAGRIKMTARIKRLRSSPGLVKLLLPGHKSIAARTEIVHRCLQIGRAYRWRIR